MGRRNFRYQIWRTGTLVVGRHLDSQLRSAGLKCVVLGAYVLWDKVEITSSEIPECAVVAGIFPGQPRKLGLVAPDCLLRWRPDRPNNWYARICRGEALAETEPLILRPSLPSELPALPYVEDGSGRAIALLQNHARFLPSQVLAVAFLGREQDRTSTFGRVILWRSE